MGSGSTAKSPFSSTLPVIFLVATKSLTEDAEIFKKTDCLGGVEKEELTCVA